MSEAIDFLKSDRAKRIRLADRVPLDKPFTIRISPSRLCDLQCEFCHHSVEEDRKRLQQIGTSGLIEWALYQRIIDDIKDSFGTVKKIVLVGRGEPILHPEVANMIAYAAKRQAAEEIELLTNGVRLSHALSDQLIDSGLTTLRISVNGLNSGDYLKYCGRPVDFDAYMEQIRYFYSRKKNTTLYVKIINYMVDSPQRLETFYRLFRPVCDIINIENLYSTNADIDFRKLTKEPEKLSYSMNTSECVVANICTSPFYILQIDEDGLVQPCCAPIFYSETSCLGDVKKESLGDIWSKRSLAFQRRLLDGTDTIPFCKDCGVKTSQMYPEDVLDDDAPRLRAMYDEKIRRQGGSPSNV